MNTQGTGDIESAIRQLIYSLVEGKKSYRQILYEWDKARGDDWIVMTKRDLEKLQKAAEEEDRLERLKDFMHYKN